MSAHRTLNDLARAFDLNGPGRLKDPGSGGTIRFSQWGQICPVVTAGAEARTLAQPTRPGILATVVLDTDGGDLTLTVTGGYNADGATSLTFADAGDFVTFMSVKVGTSYLWKVVGQEGVNVALEVLDVDTLSIGGTAVTATAAEINDATDSSAQDKMAPSTVIDGLIETYTSSVKRIGPSLIKTEIFIDITGAKSVDTDKDIIGNTGVCHFGQITTAINGAILGGQVTCLEVPVGGTPDIDFYMASVGTGAYDADGSGLANAASLITKGGNWTLTTIPTTMTAPVTANYYLYLLSGAAAAGTYTAGKFLVELWGEG